MLRSDFVATLWQHSASFVAILQSGNLKYLTASFLRCVNFASANILVFLKKPPTHLSYIIIYISALLKILQREL